MTDIDLRLAEAMCARLCHDLSNPLGSVLAAAGVLACEPGNHEALAVGHDAAHAMANSLRLLRAAWSGEHGPATRRELQELATGLPARVHADFSRLEPNSFSSSQARLILNLLLLGAEGLPFGGTVSLSGHAGREIAVALAGQRAGWPEDLSVTELRRNWSQGVPAFVAGILAREGGFTLSVTSPIELRLSRQG